MNKSILTTALLLSIITLPISAMEITSEPTRVERVKAWGSEKVDGFNTWRNEKANALNKKWSDAKDYASDFKARAFDKKLTQKETLAAVGATAGVVVLSYIVLNKLYNKVKTWFN